MDTERELALSELITVTYAGGRYVKARNTSVNSNSKETRAGSLLSHGAHNMHILVQRNFILI